MPSRPRYGTIVARRVQGESAVHLQAVGARRHEVADAVGRDGVHHQAPYPSRTGRSRRLGDET